MLQFLLHAAHVPPFSALQGARTLHVITKPDRISPGTHRDWLDRIRATPAAADKGLAPPKHGYWVVCNPGQKELEEGCDFATARHAEQRFFEDEENFASLDVTSRKRLGAAALRRQLSAMQAEALREALPGLKAAADGALAAVDADLDRLGPLPVLRDPRTEVEEALLAVAEELAAQLTGETGAGATAWRAVRDVALRFKASLADQRPVFLVNGWLLAANYDGTPGVAQAQVPSRAAGATLPVDQLRAAFRNCPALWGKADLSPCEELARDSPAQLVPPGRALLALKSLQELEALLQLHAGAQLPGFLPDRVAEPLLEPYRASARAPRSCSRAPGRPASQRTHSSPLPRPTTPR